MRTIEIRVKHGIAGRESGEVVKVEARENGDPEDLFWRRRLRDARVDGCCEVVEDEPVAQLDWVEDGE